MRLNSRVGRERELGLGVLLFLGSKIRGLRIHSLLANLKHKSRDLGARGRSGISQVVSYLGYPEISKREASC